MSDRDARIRELTYRLMEMAPEAPPFPVGPEPGQRGRPVLVWAAAVVVVIGLIGLPVLFLLPTADEPGAGPVTQPTATPPTAAVETPPEPAPVAEEYDIHVFLDPEAAAAEAEAIAAQVRSQDGVLAVVVFTRDDALEEALVLFADDPRLQDLVRRDPSILPWSVRIRAEPGSIDAIEAWLQGLPGVRQVASGPLPPALAAPDIEPPAPALGIEVVPDRVAPGDAVSVCGNYAGDGEVSVDIWHPASGYRWAEPINASIDVSDAGTWCWSGTVPAELLGVGPQGEEITAPVLPGAYEVRAASYPEEYGALAKLQVEGIDELSVAIDQGWSHVTREPELRLTGTASGHVSLRISPASGAIEHGTADFEAVVTLVPGVQVIEVTALGRSDGQAPAVARITVEYLPDAERRLAFVGEVRPEAGEIVVDSAEWLTGDAADAAAVADGYIEPGDNVPNGYYIRNLDTERTTLAIAPNPPIILQTPDGGPRAKQVTYEHWMFAVLDDGRPYDAEPADPPVIQEPDFGFFGAGLPWTPYWLTIHDGIVVQVEQQYVP